MRKRGRSAKRRPLGSRTNGGVTRRPRRTGSTAKRANVLSRRRTKSLNGTGDYRSGSEWVLRLATGVHGGVPDSHDVRSL
jgi:hypothetical protein